MSVEARELSYWICCCLLQCSRKRVQPLKKRKKSCFWIIKTVGSRYR